MEKRKVIGLYLGLIIFITILLLPTPDGMLPEAKRAAAVTLLMSIWWITEAIPISATAFLPMILFPLLGILDAGSTAVNYGHNYVLMLLAGFIIAKAFEIHNLHRRTALTIIKYLGTSRQLIILSFMLATALLSMWIANVAITLLMLPIGIAIIAKEAENGDSQETESKFGLALMLSIAYSASIGGIGTLIGTPPNMIFAGMIKTLYPEAGDISFVQWMMVGIPLVIIFLPITWLYLVKYFRIKGSFSGSKELIEDELHNMGPMTKAEKRVLIIFILTGLGWIFRKDIQLGSFTISGWASMLGVAEYVHDSTVALFSVILMFIIPTGEKNSKSGKQLTHLLNWKDAENVPWGVVMIVGGGYAIAKGFANTGLAEFIATRITIFDILPIFLVVLVVVFFMTLLTEINSNTATANTFLPILATMAVAASAHPFLLMIPGTIACSCSFLLPSGTGTNAVIFGSGRVTIPEMFKCGLFLSIIGIFVVTLVGYLIAIPVFGIAEGLPSWAH